MREANFTQLVRDDKMTMTAVLLQRQERALSGVEWVPAATEQVLQVDLLLDRSGGQACVPALGELKPQLQWNNRWNVSCVVVERRAELFAQKFFFAAHTNRRATTINCECNQQPDPVTVRQTGREQHAKHSGVNRMPHESIRPLANERVTFENARLQAPLLPEDAHRPRHQPK